MKLIIKYILIIIGLLVSLKIMVFRIIPFVDQYLLTNETNLLERYGKGKWVLITGPSSGMGERFAYEFAERGFNLVLVGHTKKITKYIKKKFKSCEIIPIELDFSDSFKDNFFDPIQKVVDDLGDKWSILINNVGYRTYSLNYEDMSILEMKKTISVGTLVQAKLIQMAIQKFSIRHTHTAIVNITAQNNITTDLFATEVDLTVPHLACYEATNVFGYCHAKSVHAEIKYKYPLIDFLIITPGAVKTKKTKKALDDIIFAVDVDVYVKNILNLMGNKNGIYCAHWGHSLSGALMNVFPFFDSESIMKKVGNNFCIN